MHSDKNISKMAQIFDDVSIFCKILKMMTSSNISAIMKTYNILFQELPPNYHSANEYFNPQPNEYFNLLTNEYFKNFSYHFTNIMKLINNQMRGANNFEKCVRDFWDFKKSQDFFFRFLRFLWFFFRLLWFFLKF